MSKKNLPELRDLINEDKLEIAEKDDKFNYLLNQSPPKSWLKEHPYISGYIYIPIDKIEYLLKKLFRRYRIEILDQGQIFNGVFVSVRVHYLHPVNDEWDFHDGIGSIELQTDKGASPADMQAIKHGAIDKALPAAKSRAVKNACFGFGKLFGSDLNREDTLAFKPNENLDKKEPIEGEDYEMVKEAVKLGKQNGGMSAAKANSLYDLTDDQKSELYDIEEGK
jgi:hypothetical protein